MNTELNGLMVSLALMLRHSRRKAEKLGLMCPFCNHNLIASKALVLASKHCGQCGKQVLTDV